MRYEGDLLYEGDMQTVSPTTARRIVLMKQHLAGPRTTPDKTGIMNVIRDLGYVQLDPTRIVAPSHLLVLWSRLGQYDRETLDELLWKERTLFEDWAHGASIVPTEDYPIFNELKRHFLTGKSAWVRRTRAWMKRNRRLRTYVLTQLRRKGPLRSRDFEDKSAVGWHSTGWTRGRNVDQMLSLLWAQGKIMIAGRVKGQKLWDLTERCLPDWAPRQQLRDQELANLVTQKSLMALGVARSSHIRQHYVRGCYPRLDNVLAGLEARQRIVRVEIREGKESWPGEWYMHADDLPLLDEVTGNEWGPRTTLLSPFDNLICNRARTEELFEFHFRLEIYLPKQRRKYGPYLMPILHGDRLIGRIDPTVDRRRRQLKVNTLYIESGVPVTAETTRAVFNAVEELGRFLGAESIERGKLVRVRSATSLGG